MADKIHDLTILSLQKSEALASNHTVQELVDLYQQIYDQIEKEFKSREEPIPYLSERPPNW